VSVQRKKRVLVRVPVTSMADLAFLLVIFFMVTSNFVKEAHVELEEASSPDVEPMKESQLSVTMDKNGDLWLQGKPCPAAVLEEGIRALILERGDKVVMLKIDKDIRQEKYGPVFMALSKAGAEIALVGRKEKE